MSENAVGIVALYFAASFILSAFQCIWLLCAFLQDRFDSDANLKDDSFSIAGSREYNSNFWSILVVGAISLSSGSIISVLQDEIGESLRDKIMIASFGLLAYVVVVSVILLVSSRRPAKRLPVSEIYWSLQRGEIIVEDLGIEYKKRVVESLDSKRNTSYLRNAERLGDMDGGPRPWAAGVNPIHLVPFLIHLIISVVATLAIARNGIGDFWALVVIWTFSALILSLSYWISFRTIVRLWRYYYRRAGTIDEFREYCRQQLG